MLHKSHAPVGFLNGEFNKLENLKVSVMDRGFIYADGVYEVIPVYQKKPFALQEHIARLFDNLEKIALSLDQNEKFITDILYKLLDLTDYQFEYIYLQVTRGTYTKREHIFPETTNPTIFAYVMPFEPASLETSSKGIKAILREDIRWDRCDIKSISLLGNVLLRQEAQQLQAQETLLHRNGYLTEGAVSNVFVVKNGKIKTPKLNNYILGGITREKVIEVSRQCNFICEETDITIEELKEADEIWVTSSTKEILPVKELQGNPITKNIDASIWKKVFIAFQQYR